LFFDKELAAREHQERKEKPLYCNPSESCFYSKTACAKVEDFNRGSRGFHGFVF
jgi:hypothetical protein